MIKTLNIYAGMIIGLFALVLVLLVLIGSWNVSNQFVSSQFNEYKQTIEAQPTATAWVVTATPIPTLSQEDWQEKILTLSPSASCCYDDWVKNLDLPPWSKPWASYWSRLFVDDGSPAGLYLGRAEITVFQNEKEAYFLAQWYLTQFAPEGSVHLSIDEYDHTTDIFNAYSQEDDKWSFAARVIQQDNVVVFYEIRQPDTKQRAVIAKLDAEMGKIAQELGLAYLPMIYSYPEE